MKLTTTDYAVLGMLGIAPMSGYQLKQFAEGTLGYFWSESFGQIYPALARLTRDGEIREVAKKKPAAGRERRVYELTAKGRKRLGDWMPEAPRAQVPRDELLLKLFFGAEAPVSVSRVHLVKQAERVRARLAEYEKVRKMLQRMHGAPPPDGSRVVWWEMTLRRGILDSRAELEWCEESLQTLEALASARNEKPKGHVAKRNTQKR